MARERPQIRHRLTALLQRIATFGTTPAHKPLDPEPGDIRAGRVLLVLGLWLVFAAGTVVGVFAYVTSEVPLDAPGQGIGSFPRPALQTDPGAELRTLRAAQEACLHAYGWVDRERSLVQVPIEKAMEMLVEREPNGFAPLGAPPPDSARQRAVDAAMSSGATRP